VATTSAETAATRMAEARVSRQHISAVPNHVEAGPTATRVYDRYSYNAEKRAGPERWAMGEGAVAHPGDETDDQRRLPPLTRRAKRDARLGFEHEALDGNK
jgi:hypothetical protein